MFAAFHWPFIAVLAATPLLTAAAARRDLGVSFGLGLGLSVLALIIVAASASAFALTPPLAAAFSALVMCAVLIAEIDRRVLIIPDPLVVALLLLAATAPLDLPILQRALGAGLLGAIFLATRSAFAFGGQDHALGLGDVKLAAAMGAWLGPQDGLIAIAVACAATACTMKLAGGGAQSARTTSAPTVAPTVAPLGIALSAALVLTVGFRLWVAP